MAATAGAKSLFEAILESADPVRGLPEHYHLPDDEEFEEFRYIDGAKDGVRLYHSNMEDADIAPYTDALYKIGAGQFLQAEAELEKLLADPAFPGVPSLIYPLHDWMMKREQILPSNNMLNFAVTEITQSGNREMVKFCMAVMSIYNIEDSKPFSQLFRKLALSDEFTYQAVSCMLEWKNHNREIFEIAKRVHGWGRIHCVFHLEANSQEIRRWMLTEGWKNTVGAGYSAYEIAGKIGLLKTLMREDLDREEFEGLCGLMNGLMEDKPLPGISAMKDADIVMNAFLKQTKGKMLTREGVSAVQLIREKRENQ